MADGVAHDAMFRETIARHFSDARIVDDEIALGFGALRMQCWVHEVGHHGSSVHATLFMQLRGGHLGETPVFASASGYGDTAEAAIVIGACNWACAFGPVLQAALGGTASADVASFDAVADGQAFRVFVDALDRAASLDASDALPRIAPARARFARDGWLARAVLDAGRLPVLHPERATLLSLFVSDLENHRLVEVKVDGVDWPGMDAVFAGAPPEPPGAMVLLRELAVAVPMGPASALSRESVERTLRGLETTPPSRRCVDWPGWRHHDGALAPVLTDVVIAALETRIGPLPPDYRDFLVNVGSSGAGPGYGLLSPIGDAQAELARGAFDGSDGSFPEDGPQGVLALAHGGCGVMWLLVLDGPHRGEVWLDARSSDGAVRQVAPSFTSWYRDWLAAAVRDASPWIAWNVECCATAGALGQIIEALERDGAASDEISAAVADQLAPGAMTLKSGANRYFVEGATLDPCHGCVSLAARFGLTPSLFLPGVPPLHAASDTSAPRRWLAKVTDKLRGRSPRN